jgi:hypothetical protein
MTLDHLLELLRRGFNASSTPELTENERHPDFVDRVLRTIANFVYVDTDGNNTR